MYPYLHLGPIGVSTYFLVISIAAILGAIWFLWRNDHEGFSRLEAIDFTLVTMASGFVGARLLHVIYEAPELYRGAPLKVLEVWNGGFVFLGGVAGGVLGAYIFCLIRKVPFLLMLDMAVIPLSFAYALGRIACFLNGCCYGGKCELPWAMTLNGVHRHPTQLYASFWEFLVLTILIKMESRLKAPGRLVGLWLLLHSVGRIVMESFRDDPRGDMIASLSLATWLSVAMFVMGIGLVWDQKKNLAANMH